MTATAKTTYSFPVPDLSDDGLAKVTAKVAESAAEYDRTGEIPWEGLEAIYRAGLITASIAPEHGGPGITARDAARVVAAVGEGDPSVAIILANTLLTHGTIAAVPLAWYEPHYEDFLARSAQGIALANGLGAEPDLGASARGGLPATNLTRSGDGWVLNGRKGWGTGGTALTYHITHVVALEEGREPRVGFVTVPTDLPGVSVLETWDHIGLRASNTHDVVYENVELPLGAFAELPRQPDGTVLNAAARPLSPGTFAHTALYLGVARAARAAFREFARSRVPTSLGKPIAETARIQTVAGELDLQIATAETLLFGSILRVENGDSAFVAQIPLIKAAIARAVIGATQAAVAALGNPGLTRHNSLERHLRNALCIRVHPPQEDAALLAAGRRVLGSEPTAPTNTGPTVTQSTQPKETI
ncbi:MAG TPA: acyl-CoA dehydrogenase family protein [Streptosporangiaceae bacterium]|jgi:alkylation response protein AidB-like acyl-CoA dehydrogenase|nr:acyl-CoA dehydrogenase family protein [Streptosporangiaceae bacterium]